MPEQNSVKSEPEQIFVKAFDVASAYDLPAVRKILEDEFEGKALETSPLRIQLEPHKMIAVFDYGSIVFFDVERDERRRIVERIKSFSSRLNKVISEDDFTLYISSHAKDPEGTDELFVKDLNRDIALVVGTVLSRSVSVEFYEKLVADALAQLERPIASLQMTGNIPRGERGLTRNVGFALAVEHELAYTLSAFDEPDIVWAGGKRIEELYSSLKRQFDLEDRIKVKLTL